jgi:hypothetical protein
MTGTVQTDRTSISGSADRLAIRLADLRQAEQAIRALLDSLKRQVGAAAEQSQRLRSGVADAHGAAASVQESVRQLPDAATMQASVDALLAGAQARLDALADTAIDRVRERMQQAQADLDAMVTTAVGAMARSTVGPSPQAAETASPTVAVASAADLARAFVEVPSQIRPVLGPLPWRVGMMARPLPTTPRVVVTMPLPMWALATRSAI